MVPRSCLHQITGNGQHGRLDQVITDIDGEFKQHQCQREHECGTGQFLGLDILHGSFYCQSAG